MKCRTRRSMAASRARDCRAETSRRLPNRAATVPSPRPERGRAEQGLLRRGLRAPVLRGRFDMAAEFGRGVPAPARIVEHAPRQCDHVGLAGGDNLLALMSFGNQPD